MKKILALLLALITLFALVSCGNEKKPDDGKSNIKVGFLTR